MNKTAILESLEPMLKEAEEKGLWLRCSYQDLWFSPRRLRDHHAKGSFIWGVTNWSLRDPRERLAQLQRRVEEAHAAAERFRKTLMDK